MFTLNNVLMIGFLIMLILLMVGLISPRMLLRKTTEPSRKRVLLYIGIPAVLMFLLYIYTTPKIGNSTLYPDSGPVTVESK